MNRTEQDFDPFERKKVANVQEPPQQQQSEQQLEKSREAAAKESRFVTFSIYVRTLDMLRTVQAVIQLRHHRKVSINELIFRFTEKGIKEEYPSAWDIIGETRQERSNDE